MKTSLLTTVALVLGLGACATSPRRGPIIDRGTVEADGRDNQHIVEGPAVFHGYMENNGDLVYLVPATGDAVADCNNAPTNPARDEIPVYKGERLELEIPSGILACLATRSERLTEMMWHLHPSPPKPAEPASMVAQSDNTVR